VADQQRDGGKEPLTEREREALQILARQFVREAGLHGEGQRELLRIRQLDERLGRLARYLETLRTAWSFQFEIAKHTSAASGVLLLGLGAFVGVFYPDLRLPQLADVAAVLLVLCAIVSIVEMILVRNVFMRQLAKDILEVESAFHQDEETHSEEDEDDPEEDEEARWDIESKHSTKWWTLVSWAAILLLASGAFCFLVFAFYNLTGRVCSYPAIHPVTRTRLINT
jgi:hypothetical protein